MTEHTQESKKKTQAEEQESDSSSRSPGVTDRELINVESSKAKEIKQSTQESQTKSSSTEDKD